MDKLKKIKFPKGFFTQPRQHLDRKENKEDCIPFKWDKKVLEGKTKVKIVSLNK